MRLWCAKYVNECNFGLIEYKMSASSSGCILYSSPGFKAIFAFHILLQVIFNEIDILGCAKYVNPCNFGLIEKIMSASSSGRIHHSSPGFQEI